MGGRLIILILFKKDIYNMEYVYVRLRRISNLVGLDEGEEREKERKREGGREKVVR